MSRIGFALMNGWRQRKRLRQFLTDPKLQVQSLTDITPERLDAWDIAILVLDFDGVLAGHGEPIPTPVVGEWLRKLCLSIGEQRIAILTNKPLPQRLTYFAQQFPSIHVVKDVRKKPYPDGLIEIASYKGVPPHRIMLVDDRLMTGMLATCLAYCQGWYFCQPSKNFAYSPMKEVFFSLLRVLERIFVRL